MAEKEEQKKALLKEHRRRERELTKQGKRPFYIKKCKACFSSFPLSFFVLLE